MKKFINEIGFPVNCDSKVFEYKEVSELKEMMEQFRTEQNQKYGHSCKPTKVTLRELLVWKEEQRNYMEHGIQLLSEEEKKPYQKKFEETYDTNKFNSWNERDIKDFEFWAWSREMDIKHQQHKLSQQRKAYAITGTANGISSILIHYLARRDVFFRENIAKNFFLDGIAYSTGTALAGKNAKSFALGSLLHTVAELWIQKGNNGNYNQLIPIPEYFPGCGQIGQALIFGTGKMLVQELFHLFAKEVMVPILEDNQQFGERGEEAQYERLLQQAIAKGEEKLLVEAFEKANHVEESIEQAAKTSKKRKLKENESIDLDETESENLEESSNKKQKQTDENVKELANNVNTLLNTFSKVRKNQLTLPFQKQVKDASEEDKLQVLKWQMKELNSLKKIHQNKKKIAKRGEMLDKVNGKKDTPSLPRMK